VNLTFSTAEPMSVKSLPELNPLFVDIQPLPVRPGKPTPKSRIASGYPVNYDQNWGLPPGKGAIKGYVTDKTTGEALIGVNLILKDTYLGSATDMDGKFYIANVPEGNYLLEASYVGYQSMKVNLQVVEKYTANLVVGLHESALEMGEAIVVTAEKPKIEKLATQSRMMVRGGRDSKIQMQAGYVRDKKPAYSDTYAKELSTIFTMKQFMIISLKEM